MQMVLFHSFHITSFVIKNSAEKRREAVGLYSLALTKSAHLIRHPADNSYVLHIWQVF